ncbi:MAG: helix-turn-helix domain-containing protein [Baekduia sp.]
MTLTFRNLEGDPRAPVSTWPYEAIVTAIERGLIGDWARLTAEIALDPWGEVARQVEEYLAYAEPGGVTALLHRAIVRARESAEENERAVVASEVRRLHDRSGLSAEQFARRIGTSRTRLSTYRTGSVTPSAALMVRMRAVADARAARMTRRPRG